MHRITKGRIFFNPSFINAIMNFLLFCRGDHWSPVRIVVKRSGRTQFAPTKNNYRICIKTLSLPQIQQTIVCSNFFQKKFDKKLKNIIGQGLRPRTLTRGSASGLRQLFEKSWAKTFISVLT